MKYRALSTLVFCASALGYSTANATSCGSAPVNSGFSLEDVTFRGLASDDCTGNLGNKVNLNGQGGALSVNAPVLFSSFGGNWGAELKDDSPGTNANGSTSYLGFDWTVATDAGTAGNWLLTLANPNNLSLPVTLDLMVLLKGGTSSNAYLFDNETFSTTGANTGTFSIKFTNGGTNIPNLSHLSLFLREGRPDENIPTIPEPGTLALLGMGVMGMGMKWRRKTA